MYDSQTTPTRDLADAWPYGFQQFRDEDPLYEYLGVYATEIARLDAFIDTLYEQRFIETANTDELEKLAAEIGITRNEGESDDAFRYRTRLRLIQAASDGTAEDMRNLFAAAFGEQLSEVAISPAPDSPVLLIVVPEATITTVPVSQTQLEAIFTDAMPCGTDIDLSTDTTFAFYGDETNAPAYIGGFGDGAWSTVSD